MNNYTCYKGLNKDLFKNILKLYSSPGENIIDFTYGKGNFWKEININDYNLLKCDILPFKDDVLQFDLRSGEIDILKKYFRSGEIDITIFDPPYIAEISKNSILNDTYNNYLTTMNYNNYDILKLYYRGILNSYNLLKNNGYLILKCMDYKHARYYYFNHINIFNMAGEIGFRCKDIFILHSDNKKYKKGNNSIINHSYFMVFEKFKDKRFKSKGEEK